MPRKWYVVLFRRGEAVSAMLDHADVESVGSRDWLNDRFPDGHPDAVEASPVESVCAKNRSEAVEETLDFLNGPAASYLPMQGLSDMLSFMAAAGARLAASKPPAK